MILDLSANGDEFLVVPRLDGEGRFVIRQHGVAQLYARFDRFMADLQARHAEGAAVARIQGKGDLDRQAALFTARVIKLHLR